MLLGPLKEKPKRDFLVCFRTKTDIFPRTDAVSMFEFLWCYRVYDRSQRENSGFYISAYIARSYLYT